ncbi:preprotein translocase subunit SecE [Clostridium tetanomorphum DSM 665]|nr:preprotein translocase subunit SecE [Clostridium tetanomorphum DSM 665]
MSADLKEKKEVKVTAPKKGGVIRFFKDLKGEFKRITWASKEDVKKATLIVLVFCFVYMVCCRCDRFRI